MNKVSTLPTWLNDLASMLQKKSETEITAETTVRDLPTVNWEDETFYVKFGEHGATLYNKFATVVKEIDGAFSLEDVDKFLNENTVTASDEEPEVVEASLAEDVELPLPEDSKDAVQEAEKEVVEITQPDAPVVEEIANEVTEQTIGNDAETQDELTKELEQIMSEEDVPATEEYVENTSPEEVQLPDHNAELNSLKIEVKELRELVDKLLVMNSEEKTANIEEDDNSLENRVAALENKCAEMYKAYTAPANDQYDLKCQDQEMEHVNKNMELSQKIIDKEHELDLSKQEDRGKLNADFLKEILDDVKENLQDFVEDSIEETKEVVEDVVENDVAPEDAVSNDFPEVVFDDEGELKAVNDDIILLEAPEAVEEFTDQVCPFCHQKHLSAFETNKGVVGVKCASCNKNFIVNMKNYKIYYKEG